jgi:hypothetical protein
MRGQQLAHSQEHIADSLPNHGCPGGSSARPGQYQPRRSACPPIAPSQQKVFKF